MPERTCPVCGNTFTPATPNQRYCPPTPEDRTRLKGQAVSRCARRGSNHAQRTRQGRDTGSLTAPLPGAFDCEQCGKACEAGKDGVSAHAMRFCGYDCKAQWHGQHEDGASRRWQREVAPQRYAQARAIERLMSVAGSATRSDEAAYRRALRFDPCAYCGGSSGASDHIVPRSAGGPNDWTNRTAACHGCNNMKQSTPLLVFLAYKQTREAFEPWRQIVAALHTR